MESGTHVQSVKITLNIFAVQEQVKKYSVSKNYSGLSLSESVKEKGLILFGEGLQIKLMHIYLVFRKRANTVQIFMLKVEMRTQSAFDTVELIKSVLHSMHS